jgi:type I restriction enzyme S subunit
MVAIGESTIHVSDGNYSSKYPKSHEFVSSGVPFVSANNLRDGRIVSDNLKFISTELHVSLKKGHVRTGDVLLVTRGSLGMTALVTEEFNDANINAQLVLLRADNKTVDARYLFFVANSPDFQSQVLSNATGTAQPQLPIAPLKRLTIPLPPLLVQCRIAGILSAYDDLIENNQRRIKILEEMARSLYREWFVHFRFPSHDKVKMVSSALGPIPQGWEVKRMPECVDVNPRIFVPRDGEKPFVPMGCLSNGFMLISDIESRNGNSGAKFQNGDTLFARITPCLENGKTGFVQFLPDEQAVAFGSTEFIVLRSRTLTPEFVYLLARSDEFRSVAIKSMTGATGRQRVQEQCFNDFHIAQSPRALLDRFSDIVAPSFRLIYKLHLQTQSLRRTRDLLLPRLLSGQITVSG